MSKRRVSGRGLSAVQVFSYPSPPIGMLWPKSDQKLTKKGPKVTKSWPKSIKSDQKLKNVNKRWQKESFVSSSWGKAQKIPLESPLHNNLDFSHFQPLTKKLNPPEFLFWDPSIPIFVKQPPGFFHLMPEIAIFWEKAKRRIFERRLKGESLREG